MKDFIVKNYLHIICVTVSIISLLFGVFCFPNAVCRLCEAIIDICLSFAYYCTEITENTGLIKVTVNNLPAWQIAYSKYQPLSLMPTNFDKFTLFWQRFVNSTNFAEYVLFIIRFLTDLYTWLLPIMSFLMFLYIKYKNIFTEQNNDYNKDSWGVKFIAFVYSKIILKVFRFLKKLYFFAVDKKYIKYNLFLWAFYFNFFTIFIEVFAYYFYFLVSFDFIHLPLQVYKLVLDLQPIILFMPLIFWICFGFYVWNRWAESIGTSRLRHNENKNRGFCNERQIFVYIIGLMGAGKTTQAVDMALTYSVQMRDDAFEVITENALRFPMFPFINFERVLREKFESHEIYDTRRCKLFVRACRDEFLKNHCRENIFDYDFETYAMTYYNRLSQVSIWEALEEYAQAYFVYTIQTSLLVSTFSIREDIVMQDIKNFPLWNHDFFSRDARLLDSFSKCAHIFDQDLVRLGNVMVKNNPNRYAFGFGVYIWDELDKERKNSLELQEIKATAKECNQKNDLMEPMIKIIRHGCMIGRRNFVKCIGTGQRADDLGAKLRGVCEVLNISNVSDDKLTLPFWSPYFVFMDFFGKIVAKFTAMYYQYRFNRSDNIVYIQMYNCIVSKIAQYQEIIQNRFGYQVVTIDIEKSKIQSLFKKHKFYRAFDKVRKERFVSDASGDMFDRRRDLSLVGLADIPSFSSKRATAYELDLTNSHFWNEHKNM